MDIMLWLLIIIISASGGCAIGLFWAGAKMLEREADAYAKGWKQGRAAKIIRSTRGIYE